ncbi:hypothetical protein M0R45_035096 [Rubus argutus]|uniref:Uncharacterized protein n=1 Tax=Rubus argutus TaxID=59490 RepID=A0AAW1VUK9_RUBAR
MSVPKPVFTITEFTALSSPNLQTEPKSQIHLPIPNHKTRTHQHEIKFTQLRRRLHKPMPFQTTMVSPPAASFCRCHPVLHRESKPPPLQITAGDPSQVAPAPSSHCHCEPIQAAATIKLSSAAMKKPRLFSNRSHRQSCHLAQPYRAQTWRPLGLSSPPSSDSN